VIALLNDYKVSETLTYVQERDTRENIPWLSSLNSNHLFAKDAPSNFRVCIVRSLARSLMKTDSVSEFRSVNQA